MSGYNRGNNIDSIKPLYYIANFLALIPFYSDKKYCQPVRYKLYAVFIAVLLTSACISGILNIIETPTVNSTIFVLQLISFTLTTLSVILSVLITCFQNADTVNLFNERFREIDRYFGNAKATKPIRSRSQFYWEFLSFHFIYISFLLYDVYISLDIYGVNYFKRYILRRVSLYSQMILVLLIHNYCVAIKLRFRKLNKHLSDNGTQIYFQYVKIIEIEKLKLRKSQKAYLKIVEARNIFSRLTQLVHQFSRIFGWQILFLTAVVGIVTLELISRELSCVYTSQNRIKLFLICVLHMVSTTRIFY